MRTQAQQLAAGGKAQSTDDLEAIEQELEAAEHENDGEAEPEKDFGFLAVCAGEGLANVFTDLGADGVISGGQTMNPSTESILKEIKKVPAHTVFVLPNNKNIIMAAQQCIGLTEKTVVVIPTASIPQGVSAMMAVDPDMSDADAIAKAMTDAAQCVSTAQITYAAEIPILTASTSTRAIIWHFWTASCSAPTTTSPRCSTGSPTRQRPAKRSSSPSSTARM